MFEEQYEYDCMGNVTSLKRNGLQDGGTYGLIDDLTLDYEGNQLIAVYDDVTDPTYNNAWNFSDGVSAVWEYEYDKNGNLTKDLNKNISSIQYNSLNLPTQILFADGNAIRYTYSADGRKLRAEYTTAMPATTKTINYCGNLIFENGTLKQILVEGGYIMMDDWSHPYCFYIKDHLGNNRMVVNQRGTVDQVNNYYPYGGLMANSTGWNTQRYKYNGKELNRMHGLDWYDYGARWQDAAIGGRWHAMDPLCEKYYDVTPYGYCMNNPVKFVDPDGESPFSALIKFAAKQGVKTGIKTYVKRNIENRLKNYMSKNMLKQFAKDVDDVIGVLDNSWWETAIEFVPVAGDIYGSAKFTKQMKTVYDRLQDIENKYVGKIAASLPDGERKSFVKKMRSKGVYDARKDQSKGLDMGGKVRYKKGYNIEGHHKEPVSTHPDKMTDPRNIEFMEKEDHIKHHQQYGTE